MKILSNWKILFLLGIYNFLVDIMHIDSKINGKKKKHISEKYRNLPKIPKSFYKLSESYAQFLNTQCHTNAGVKK